MTNIAIIGLGLMGASFAKKLTHLNYNVYGIDVSEQTIDKAKELKIIVDGSTNPLDVISKCDTFIFCLYPTKILPWVEVYQNDIPKHSLLMDISGVKTNIVKPIQDVLREDLELLSIHPMCGRESRGIEFSDETIFKGSNFILVPTQKNKSETIESVKDLATQMEFGRICTLSIEEHDKMIGFLSQLTHVIAVSLMNTHDNAHLVEYTGDSFRDLTRIAKINEDLWTELFIMNKDILLDDTKTIIKYSPYQKMFMDLNSNFIEEDVKKYMGDHRLIGGKSSLGDYFEYHIFLSKDDNKKACQEFVAVRFLKDGQLEGFRYVSPEFEGYVFYYAKGVFLEFNDQNAKDYSGYYYRSLPKKGNKKGLEIEYKDNTKRSTPYYPISNAKEAINFLIEK